MLPLKEARMGTDNRNDLGEMLKLRRVMIPLTLQELATMSGVSPSHLGRIEKGERSPSARILRRIAKPLGFGDAELLTQAGYLSPQPSPVEGETHLGKLDPYVAMVLSQEPVEIQRAVVAILTVIKSVARRSGCNSFAEYIHRNYPHVADDIITMIEDILEHPEGQGIEKGREQP